VKAVVVAALVVLTVVFVMRWAGDDGGDGPSVAADQSPAQSSPSSDVRLRTPSAVHPHESDCHALSAEQVRQPHDTKDPVRCRDDHTTQTYYVGTFDLSIISDRSPSTADIAEFVTPRCDRKFNRWIGGDRVTRILSRVHPVWFVPDARDIKLGARWFRCDVVVSASDSRLAPLPRNTEGMLDSDSALNRYGLCSRGSPERPHAKIVACSQPHTWQAFTALGFGSHGSDRFPDRDQRREARQRCIDQAREEQDFPLEWTYGWQAPTRNEWAAGMRWGVCWVPRD
jgi:Septum formation